jgi:transcriptional regulator with XRE-family HTH domain
MAADGTPDFATIKGGEEIARLRTQRGWSRAKLIARLLDQLDTDDPSYDSISEAYLARLENGRMVKIARSTIEALCRALLCSKQERARVIQLFDRNILATSGSEPTAVAEMLNRAVAQLQEEADEILASLLHQRRAVDLDEYEILELTAAALDMVIKRRNKTLDK